MTSAFPFALLTTMGITFEQLHSYPQDVSQLQSYSYLANCLQVLGTQG